jgi:hypothetical protein
MMPSLLDRFNEMIIAIIDSLFGMGVFIIHVMRTFWTWSIRGGFPQTRNDLTTVVHTGSPLLQGRQVQVHMYETYSMDSYPIFTVSEKYLTLEFKEWLKASGAYKISVFEPFHSSIHSRYIVIYFSSEAQMALYKLTWGCDA